MSFWDLSDGNKAEELSEFDSQFVELIPDNTSAIACIDSAEWKEHQNQRYINLSWTILDGEYKGFKLFQKVRVRDENAKKRDKAIRMLAAIDMNAGGGLRKLEQEPEDLDLSMMLSNKVMGIKVMTWEMDGSSGNWVSMVQSSEAAKNASANSSDVDLDEDIDF